MPGLRTSAISSEGPRPVSSQSLNSLSPRAQEIADRDVHPSHLLILVVKDREETEVFFRIPRTTRLRKLMNSYMERQGLNDLVFYYGDKRLSIDHTPLNVSEHT